jgi:phytoene dehydrogenase-like protein
MPDTILRDLQLERHGYRGIPVGPYFVPFPDGRSITQSDDAKATTTSSRSSRKRDADALERWEAWIGGLADVLGPLLMRRLRGSALGRSAMCRSSSRSRGGTGVSACAESRTSRV